MHTQNGTYITSRVLLAPWRYPGRFGANFLVAVGIRTSDMSNRKLVTLSTALFRITSAFLDHLLLLLVVVLLILQSFDWLPAFHLDLLQAIVFIAI
jgi:hypothetical protein